MIEVAPDSAWEEFAKLLPGNSKRRDPKRYLPVTLPYQGELQGPPGALPSPELLECLRKWVLTQSETRVFYFITEFAEGDVLDYQANIKDLSYDALF